MTHRSDFQNEFIPIGRVSFLIVILLSLIMTYFVIGRVNINYYRLEVLAGWFLSIVFAFLNIGIAFYSKNPNMKRFFFGALLLGPLNQIALLMVAFFVMRWFNLNAKAFIITLLITYFWLMAYQVTRLYLTDKTPSKELFAN